MHHSKVVQVNYILNVDLENCIPKNIVQWLFKAKIQNILPILVYFPLDVAVTSRNNNIRRAYSAHLHHSLWGHPWPADHFHVSVETSPCLLQPSGHGTLAPWTGIPWGPAWWAGRTCPYAGQVSGGNWPGPSCHPDTSASPATEPIKHFILCSKCRFE